MYNRNLRNKSHSVSDELFHRKVVVFNIWFLSKYRVKCYDYIVQWRSDVACNWCVYR